MAEADSMVERVAKAICPNKAHQCKRCEALARAAIAAMREPSDDMLEAGYGLYPLATQWNAMIDAALDTEPAR